MKLPFFKRKQDAQEASTSEFDRVADEFANAVLEVLKGDAWRRSSVSKETERLNPALCKAVTDFTGRDRGLMGLALLRRARGKTGSMLFGEGYMAIDELKRVAGRLLTTQGALSHEQLPIVIEAWKHFGTDFGRFAGMAESLALDQGMTADTEQILRGLIKDIENRNPWGLSAADRKVIMRFKALLDPANASKIEMPEPWQEPFRGDVYLPLVKHAVTATSNQMSDRWAKTAKALLAEFGTEKYLDTFEESVAKVSQMAVTVDALHADMLRGFAWFAGTIGTSRAAALLGRLAIASGHKISGFGARSQKGFGGAIGALEAMRTFDAVAQISATRNRVKSPSLSALVTASLTRAAEKMSLPIEDLEELVVPTFGLELPGVLTETLGSVDVRIEISNTTDAELRWFREGKELKAPPAEVKQEHAAELKQLKATAKEMETMLAAQRARIEGLMLSARRLPYSAWRERYLDHPLLADMSRRLIWEFSSPGGEHLGIAPDGEPIDFRGEPVPGLADETNVQLWHPIRAVVSVIEAWRDFLVAREIRQPFKQAYREIYILTDAELRTNTYTNRFAAHILKQHQFAALARARGWRYALQGPSFDNTNHPTLDLPSWGLEAEYFVEVADVASATDEGTSDAGIAIYVATDQVRFNDRMTGHPVELESLPAILFSEVLRDVDLFVGVSSVGNDPAWGDHGNRDRWGGYWGKASFGDLSATAETRKAVLERLLPRLAFGSVSRIEGKFLIVKGHRRTYKIHLGSGNILMEPNDQYLCIVPGGNKDRSNNRVYLPFEGDGVLAIILSKALMLANDDKITDRVILRQL
ncbi:MAG TPA: DUF4132 domain-containing protein [Fimbriimonas sp.]|nr:DUF4132 domain-containing protein [Fimbriimonas sp.]